MNKFRILVLLLKCCFVCGTNYKNVIVSSYFENVTTCPCSDPALCQPIKETTRKEVFAFSLRNVDKIWSKYDWSKVTTLVMVGYVNLDLMCLAHKHGARVVTIANIPKSLLPNATARAVWLGKQLKTVQNNYLDGINFDFEELILQNETSYRDSYTKLVSEAYTAFKNASPFYQVTVDVAWSPLGIDLRYYDYKGLASVSDFLFIMAYDEQSQIRGPCVAAPNSPLSKAINGTEEYIKLGIPSSKLVLGVPWYGYVYPCLTHTSNDTCYIKHVPFRGVNCSDAAGSQINYYSVKDYLNHSKEGIKWDPVSQTPYFTFYVYDKYHQIQFDNPKSLQIKYGLVSKYNLRGVGMWNTDAVDYLSNTTEAIKERTEMWAAIPKF